VGGGEGSKRQEYERGWRGKKEKCGGGQRERNMKGERYCVDRCGQHTSIVRERYRQLVAAREQRMRSCEKGLHPPRHYAGGRNKKDNSWSQRKGGKRGEGKLSSFLLRPHNMEKKGGGGGLRKLVPFPDDHGLVERRRKRKEGEERKN